MGKLCIVLLTVETRSELKHVWAEDEFIDGANEVNRRKEKLLKRKNDATYIIHLKLKNRWCAPAYRPG